ncbi:MAG TPA: hypothetical protein VKT51_04145 [Candidatus Eremiobacteraceae bacterium]|nr:hypothetical protein [Candidatus Eremiobacteraceae bacterium]
MLRVAKSTLVGVRLHTHRFATVAFAFVASCLGAGSMGVALADPTPSPTPTLATHRISVHSTIETLFLTQGASGPGLRPVEGPGFANGAPAAPVSPYDVFSGAPMVPGLVGQNQLTLTAAYRAKGVDFAITFGAESLVGDRTNEEYWAEPLLPEDNPHLGSRAIGLSIVFPTHPGTDDYIGTRAGISQASITSDGGKLSLRGGWLNLNQSLGFVFTAPPTTNALAGLLLKTPESLNPNSPALDAWAAPPSTLPMRGLDLTFSGRRFSIEATDAALPALPGTPVRLTGLSVGGFDDAGHGAMVQTIDVRSGGTPIITTTGFGAALQIVPTDQGQFALSTLYGQRESITGARIAEPIGLGFDAAVDYAHSVYQADGLGKPQKAGGSWAHASLAHGLGSATLTLHYYRFEPTYATIIMPYGVPENVWSVAYSWPGPWLKSNYQLVDTTALGVNRQGPMIAYSFASKTVQANASYASFKQITPITSASLTDLGFVEGFFLVQRDPADATLGSFKRLATYVGKTFGFGTLGLDFVDDGLHRDASPRAPFDAVSYDVPQTVLSWSRPIGDRALLGAGAGYYGMRGSWADGAATNVDYGMHAYYAGAQFAQVGSGALMVTLRRSDLRGAPYFGALHALRYGSPAFDATTLLVEERLKI